MPRPYRRMTPEELERARELIDEGVSIRETARTLGRSAMTVQRHFAGESKWDRKVEAQMRKLRRELQL
jgi:DNA invertase Pin-like site-specific DNA recombinase